MDWREFARLCEIIPNLYISSATPSQELHTLQQNGIRKIVNLTAVHPCLFPDHIKYLHLPIQDMPGEDLLLILGTACDFIQRALDCSHGVLVHCSAGVSRSAAVCIAYLMKHSRLSLAEAYTRVKQARSVISPNPGFIEQLIKWEKQIVGGPPSMRVTEDGDVQFIGTEQVQIS